MKKVPAKRIVKIVKNAKWFVQGFNGFPLYLHCVASNTGWMGSQAVGVNYSHFFYRANQRRIDMYYDESDLQKIGDAYYRRIKNVKMLHALRVRHTRQYMSAKKKTDAIPLEQVRQCSFKTLVAHARLFAHQLTMTINFSHVIEGIAWISERRLKTFLEQHASQNKGDFQLLSSPIDASFILEAQRLLSKIRKSSSTQRQRLIKKFQAEFCWLDSSFVQGKMLSPDEIVQKAEELTHIPSLRGVASVRSKKMRLMQRLHINQAELFVVQTIEACTKWQDDRKRYILQTIASFEPIIHELARRLRVTPDVLKYICPNEITYKNLSSKKFLQQLRSRYPACDYYVARKQIAVYAGKEQQFFEKAFSRDNIRTAITALMGTIANMGCVAGKVRLCLTIDDISKVEKGEILVTSMTRPEFLPAMYKAAAFVTNEGGITSHAAIVSREMNKPCIIGTKIATKVLKDGDMVEVNANHGAVKIMKRK